MCRRCLNSAILANATHKKLGKVVDDQQVEGEDDSKKII